jgi:hypothetical protein
VHTDGGGGALEGARGDTCLVSMAVVRSITCRYWHWQVGPSTKLVATKTVINKITSRRLWEL